MQTTKTRLGLMLVTMLCIGGVAREGAAQTATCPCPAADVQWDALAGGVVKGSHRLHIDVDAWNQFTFQATYVYGLTSWLALGLTSSYDLAVGGGVADGVMVGVPLIFSLLNNEHRSARVALTPGFFHAQQNPHRNEFFLRVEANYGLWLRRNVLMVGPAALVQLQLGSDAVGAEAGYFEFRMPFMGGAFAEFHATSFMAITATVLFGANYDRRITDGRQLDFAYRTLLGLSFFVPSAP